MATAKNPFNPGFGSVPRVFIDREETVSEISDGIRQMQSSPYQTTLLYGVRGSGKTAVLNDVCESLKSDKNWLVIYLSSNGDLLNDLIAALIETMPGDFKSLLEKMGFSVNIGSATRSKTAGISHDTFSHKVALEKIMKKLKTKKMSLLVAIDEAANSDSMRKFASLYNVLKNQGYPIALIMTGLPKNISSLQNDKVLTFLLRCARVDMTPLNMLSVKYSYKKVFSENSVKIDDEVLAAMTKMTKGYAYAFQLLGYLVWKSSEKNVTLKTLKSVTDEYCLSLFRNAYVKIYEDLSEGDRQIITAMTAYDGEVPVKALADELGKSKEYISNYRRRLLDDGVIGAAKRGAVTFALPYFKEFVIEMRGIT